MSLPPCVSEDEFVRVVEHVGKVLYAKVGKLHGSKEDFAQQVAIWALEALPRYDSARPLDKFIYSHARNRALNWLRDNYSRSDYPCEQCHSGSPCGEDGNVCRRHAGWLERNQAKANLAKPASLDHAPERTGPSTAEEEAAERELNQLIDQNLPVDLRAYYLRLLAGEKVETAHKKKVQAAIAEILGLETGKDQSELPADETQEDTGESAQGVGATSLLSHPPAPPGWP